MPTVMFLGELRKAAGRSTVQIEADTVVRLLAAMETAVGPGFAGLLSKDGLLQPDVEVLVNGRNIEFLERRETPLRSADQVTIFYSGLRGFPGG